MKGLLSAALEARQVSENPPKDCWENRALSSREGRGVAGSQAVPSESKLGNTEAFRPDSISRAVHGGRLFLGGRE